MVLPDHELATLLEPDGPSATAYLLTGSVGLLSDALESGINLFAAVTAYLSLWYAARPADLVQRRFVAERT